jgi:hypothetical protein
MTTPLLLTRATGPKPPPLVPRAPLGPFPQPIDYQHTLSFTPPTGRDLYFYRGQFCGIRIPGAPNVPGNNPANADLVMSCLIDNYPAKTQDAFLLKYAQDGYTHLQRSIGHSIYYRGTVASHIALSKRAQAYGLFCDEWFLGAEAFNARDQTASYWGPIMDPIVGQMLDAGVVDTACVGWQLDQFNTPGNPLLGIIAWFAWRLPSSIPLYTHWVNEALAWWKTGGEVWSDAYQTINVHDRFSWWLACQPYLTGGHHQGDTHMARTNPALYQAKMRDTLNPFNDGRMGQSWRSHRNFALDVFECTAQDQFDGGCSEDEGDLVGYILTCTTADGTGAPVNGYGNGARMPDGTRL